MPAAEGYARDPEVLHLPVKGVIRVLRDPVGHVAS